MRELKNAKLVVFGRGILKNELERKAKSLGVDALFISDYISEESLADLYAAADVFVLPSLFEPCPLVLLEAMACGNAIVATNVGGIPELIHNRKNGLLVQPANPHALADAISELLSDEKLAKKLAKNARMLAVKKFSWDRTAKNVEQFYRML
jgi:glycosyltransferase involved in cell wall biosynthesis